MKLSSEHIEEQLKKLAPAPLSSSLLERLDQAMVDGASEAEARDEKIIAVSSDAELASLEERLSGLVPYGVPKDMIARLDNAMSRWHEEVPEKEKVVELHPTVAPKRSSSLGLRSVAAVGLLGACAAFLTSGDPSAPTTAEQRIPVLSNGYAAPAVFTPNDAGSSVVVANDHGIVWTEGGSPVRCLEVQVNDKIQFVNGHGEKLTLEKPKREVRFTTVKFD